MLPAASVLGERYGQETAYAAVLAATVLAVEAAALVIAVLAALGSLASAILAYKARADASRSADAAERSALAAENANSLVKAGSSPWNVLWTRRLVLPEYQLTRGGYTTAREVKIAARSPDKLTIGGGGWSALSPGESVTFEAMWQTPGLDLSIEITWRDDGSNRCWRTTLPPPH